jgi:hypothetical protein
MPPFRSMNAEHAAKLLPEAELEALPASDASTQQRADALASMLWASSAEPAMVGQPFFAKVN